MIVLHGVVLCRNEKRCNFLFSFFFHSHIQVFSCAISSQELPTSWFSSHFSFLDFAVFLSGFMLPMLVLVAVISRILISLMLSFSSFIDASMQSSMPEIHYLPSLIDTYNPFMSSLGSKHLCIAIDFLFPLTIHQSSSHVHLKNCTESLSMRPAWMYISSKRFFFSAEPRLEEFTYFFALLFPYFVFHHCFFDGVRF